MSSEPPRAPERVQEVVSVSLEVAADAPWSSREMGVGKWRVVVEAMVMVSVERRIRATLIRVRRPFRRGVDSS